MALSRENPPKKHSTRTITCVSKTVLNLILERNPLIKTGIACVQVSLITVNVPLLLTQVMATQCIIYVIGPIYYFLPRMLPEFPKKT